MNARRCSAVISLPLSGSRSRVGVEEELLLAEGEVVDRAQQRTIVEDPAAKPQHELS